jgi:pSer/pThr/pTyr-binding forkhead associated (FHA) protein
MSNAPMPSSGPVEPSVIGLPVPPPTFRLRLLLREVSFDADEVTLGRAGDCAMSVDDELLSRHHATIVRLADGFELRDLGSRNGTWLNGHPLREPTRLDDGDRIRLGTSEVVFVLDIPGVVDDDPQRRLETARFSICLSCSEARPADMIACARCGAASPPQ